MVQNQKNLCRFSSLYFTILQPSQIKFVSENRLRDLNYRMRPPLGKSIGFWHGSGLSMTTRWCFLFENRFGFLFSAFISFITLSPISKYLKSVIFNLAKYSITRYCDVFHRFLSITKRVPAVNYVDVWRSKKTQLPGNSINPLKQLIKTSLCHWWVPELIPRFFNSRFIFEKF